MSNSSDDFLNDNITISSIGSGYPTDTFTITSPITIDMSSVTSGSSSASTYYYTTGAGMAGSNSSGTVILSGGTYSTSIDTGSSTFSWINPVPFETGFPDWYDFQEMCKEYPGMEKTFEHLKAFYKLCKDDWESKKRGNND